MNKIKFVWSLSLMLLALTAGCSESGSSDTPVNPPKEDDPIKVDDPYINVLRSMDSNSSCTLDSDCQEGSFCFQKLCAIECNESISCDSGFVCDISRGRCVTDEYVAEAAKVMKQIEDAGESMSSDEKNALLAALEHKAMTSTDVVTTVIGQKNTQSQNVNNIALASRVPTAVWMSVDKGKLTVSLENNVGDIQYLARLHDGRIPVLKKAKAVQNANGSWNYSFDIDATSLSQSKKHLLRDGRDDSGMDSVEIVSGIGNYEAALLEHPEVHNIYGGYVVPSNVLSGIDLPIRMAIVTEPANPKNFAEIQKLTVYLPVSGSDIFSPENVDVDASGKITEKWASVEINSKDIAANCHNDKECFAAVFSTNDFAPYNSILFDKDSHVNRNIRIEFDDYSPDSMSFSGKLIDRLEGLYRESKMDANGNVERHWNVAQMDGNFMVVYKDTFDPEAVSVHSYAGSNVDNLGLRDISENPKVVCSNDAFNAFKDLITPQDCSSLEGIEKTTCENIHTCHDLLDLNGFLALDASVQYDCLTHVINQINNDETRLSYVLEQVLVADVSSNPENKVVEVCGTEVGNFEDFRNVCASSTCGLCKERPELICAADLLANLYHQGSGLSIENKTSLMNYWASVVNEYSLPFQYLAWNDDTDIRKQWLTGAVYSRTFAASLMEDFNQDLLENYRTKVMDVQRGIMGKQFNQLALEMLSSSLVDASNQKVTEMSSSRNGILSQMGSVWESVASSLGLSSRRHDVITQNDAERLKAASELKPYLFDLYFAGLVESNLNLNADQGSLNATYGTNLASIISKLESLDQPFESLVFMRDGEIFVDTRLETDKKETALDRVSTTAKEAVESAVTKRKEVFAQMTEKNKKVLSVNDSYLSALESIRAEIVSLCGYPSDCKDDNRKTCALFTEPGFCGFSLSSVSTQPVDPLQIDESGDSSLTISQVTDYADCIKALQDKAAKDDIEMSAEAMSKQCGGGALELDSDDISYSDDVNTSKAGIAILAYRKADQEYRAALSEYEVMKQKVENNFVTLDAYAKNIQSWYNDRAKLLEKIQNNMADIKALDAGLVDINAQKAAEELKSAQNSYEEQKSMLIAWEALTAASQIASNALSTLTNRYNMLASISADTAKYYEFAGLVGASVGATAVSAQMISLRNALNASVAFDRVSANKSLAKTLSTGTVQFISSGLSFKSQLDSAKIQKDLKENIDKIKTNISVSGNNLSADEVQALINELEHNNALFAYQNEHENEYLQDIQELEKLRNEYKNAALDLISLVDQVLTKEVALGRAALNYYQIVQQAQLLSGQYDSKLARYKEHTNMMFSASAFFQYASDLEDVESYIEFARNDLSDYLTAVEYMTVRPFVELRRSIYTARGTNDFEELYEQISDLRNKCGSGEPSTNKVAISLRKRMNIADASVDGLTAAERFHQMLAKGALPVNAQARYTTAGTLGEKLKGGFYSGSFSLTSNFANIADSCNAKIDEIRVRFISIPGKKIRSNDVTPSISLFYGGQGQLLSCHSKIEAIVSSIGSRTSFGKYSTFTGKPFADGINAGIYDVGKYENYKLSDDVEFSNVTAYSGLQGYPLMATYTIVFDPQEGENSKIIWDNVADIELQIKYTTGSLGMNSNTCKYDIQ